MSLRTEHPERWRRKLDRKRERRWELAAERTCTICGSTFTSANHDAVYCSPECQRAGVSSKLKGVSPSKRTLAASRLAIAAKGTRAKKVRQAGPCMQCGAPVVGYKTKGTGHACSLECKQQRRYSLKVGRKTVRRNAIFERDGYRCGICGEPTDPTAKCPHPLAPTIDHVIPRARGGSHDPGNLQCAHFLCNSRKSDTIAA